MLCLQRFIRCEETRSLRLQHSVSAGSVDADCSSESKYFSNRIRSFFQSECASRCRFGVTLRFHAYHPPHRLDGVLHNRMQVGDEPRLDLPDSARKT